ncbi:hypothetical protein SK128_023679 [Halocaridina rubra]|uniref:Uncharacterized protein n=1 Tax=Halocaridina rubra TaxID=373956 RepID=A0AAN8X3X0_HALRR
MSKESFRNSRTFFFFFPFLSPISINHTSSSFHFYSLIIRDNCSRPISLENFFDEEAICKSHNGDRKRCQFRSLRSSWVISVDLPIYLWSRVFDDFDDLPLTKDLELPNHSFSGIGSYLGGEISCNEPYRSKNSQRMDAAVSRQEREVAFPFSLVF